MVTTMKEHTIFQLSHEKYMDGYNCGLKEGVFAALMYLEDNGCISNDEFLYWHKYIKKELKLDT